MACGIELRWVTSNYRYGLDDGIRVYISVACAQEMTDKIFAYRLLPKNPSTGTYAGYFDHVCSPVDLEDYPEDAPRDGHRPTWFRLSYVDVIVATTSVAETFINDVREDVRKLVATLNRMEQMTVGGVDTIGDTCSGSSSEADT